jgi:hypothetical protein
VDTYEKVAKTLAPKREALQKAESDYQVKFHVLYKLNITRAP